MEIQTERECIIRGLAVGFLYYGLQEETSRLLGPSSNIRIALFDSCSVSYTYLLRSFPVHLQTHDHVTSAKCCRIILTTHD